MLNRGYTFTELLVGVLLASVIFLGVYKFTKSSIQGSTAHISLEVVNTDLNRFRLLMQKDIQRAGNDPLGNSLQGYLIQAVCGGKLIMKNGINPDPANNACLAPLGSIGLLSYLPYDSNSDGTIDPEEGLTTGTVPPPVRTPVSGKDYPADYVTYAYVDTDSDGKNDAIERRLIDQNHTVVSSLSAVVLKGVSQFDISYYGIDDTGTYGEVTDKSRYNDITQVKVVVAVKYGNADASYINPNLSASSPYYHYHTSSVAFQVPLIQRKE